MSANPVSSAREAAFAALMACETRGAWCDQAVRSAAKKWALPLRDAALAARLCYGVVQNRILLDFWIDSFSNLPAHKLDVPVRLSLRMGLYQLHFLDRVPDRAAVHESVELVRRYCRNKGAAGMVNAVLRTFQRAGAPPVPEREARLKKLSVLYSHPLPLVELLAEELGDDVEPLLALNNTPADTVVQLNPLKTTRQALADELRRTGVEVQEHPWLEDCLLVRGSGDLERLSPFLAGHFYVQDAAAKLCALAAEPSPGSRVLDVCAAPGGKSFALGLSMKNQCEILARDLHGKKLRHIEAGAARLGLSCIRTAQADARCYQPELDSAFDLVVADVPCSGLGIIRKKPDIRYKDLKDTEGLPAIQADILDCVSRYVRPGGTLLYSTCTVLRRENQDVIASFLKKRSGFVLEPFGLPGPVGETDGQITLWPQIHGTDGFYIAKLRRANG